MVQKSITRDKVMSVKMSQATYKKFVELAHAKDLMPSTMAYLIIRQYMAMQLGDEHGEAAADFLL